MNLRVVGEKRDGVCQCWDSRSRESLAEQGGDVRGQLLDRDEVQIGNRPHGARAAREIAVVEEDGR